MVTGHFLNKERWLHENKDKLTNEQVDTIFFVNKITQMRYFVRARILPVLGLVFFQSPMFARHSTRSV